MICIICDLKSEEETEIGRVDVRAPKSGEYKYKNVILCKLCVKKFQAIDYNVSICRERVAQKETKIPEVA